MKNYDNPSTYYIFETKYLSNRGFNGDIQYEDLLNQYHVPGVEPFKRSFMTLANTFTSPDNEYRPAEILKCIGNTRSIQNLFRYNVFFVMRSGDSTAQVFYYDKMLSGWECTPVDDEDWQLLDTFTVTQADDISGAISDFIEEYERIKKKHQSPDIKGLEQQYLDILF